MVVRHWLCSWLGFYRHPITYPQVSYIEQSKGIWNAKLKTNWENWKVSEQVCVLKYRVNKWGSCQKDNYNYCHFSRKCESCCLWSYMFNKNSFSLHWKNLGWAAFFFHEDIYHLHIVNQKNKKIGYILSCFNSTLSVKPWWLELWWPIYRVN